MNKEEKEIKIELNIPLDIFLTKILEFGFKKKKEITQCDNYFDTENWDLYKNVAAFRIRQVDGIDHSFAFKKMFCLPNRSNSYYIEEIEDRFPIADSDKLKTVFDRLGIEEKDYNISNGDRLSEILKKNGFQGEQIMMKIRQVFRDSDGNEIVIDDVDDVGTIIELECEEKDPMDVVQNLLCDGEWTRSILGTGYIWLEKVKGFSDHLTHKTKFEKNPDWNVWKNEREMYNSLIG